MNQTAGKMFLDNWFWFWPLEICVRVIRSFDDLNWHSDYSIGIQIFQLSRLGMRNWEVFGKENLGMSKNMCKRCWELMFCMQLVLLADIKSEGIFVPGLGVRRLNSNRGHFGFYFFFLSLLICLHLLDCSHNWQISPLFLFSVLVTWHPFLIFSSAKFCHPQPCESQMLLLVHFSVCLLLVFLLFVFLFPVSLHHLRSVLDWGHALTCAGLNCGLSGTLA